MPATITQIYPPPKSPFFRSSDGRWLLQGGEIYFGDKWYMSDDGVEFFELHAHGAAIQGDHAEFTIEEGGKEKEIVVDRDTASFDGRVYKRASAPAGAKLIPIPSVRSQAYLLEQPTSGLVFYVSQDLNHFDYDTMRFYVGRLPNLMEIPIVDVVRFRDGGTTVIETKAGKLYVPTRWKPQEVATWTPRGGSPIALIPVSQSFSFVEAGGRAVAEAGP